MIKESNGKISDRLYAIGNPGLPAFLLLGKKPALFEAGMTFMGPAYLKELNAYLGDVGHLCYLLLTHSHYDHCGAAPFLKRKIPGLQIGASRLAAEIFKRPNAVRLIRNLSQDPEERSKPLIGDEDVSFHSLEVDLPLTDGAEMLVGDGDRVRIIATPGHTRDALSFYIPGWKTLIAGEAVGAFDRNFSIRPEFLSSYDDYLASLEKLAALDIQILVMAHSYMLTGEEARGYMARSIEATGRFKKRIETLLDRWGGDQEGVVMRIFKEDYEDAQAILQDEEPFRINLRAKVKVVAEKK
jgi:glyoxylase-like metal-dependent hydrolase (beta-lactamase superfamily II)